MLATMVGLGTILGGVVMTFTPPGPQERKEAIGSTAGLSPDLARAFEPDDAFRHLPRPGRSDWLANHPEPGQTFEDFVHSHPNRPDSHRNKLYLQPLGEFRKGQSPPLEQLRAFAAAFFMMDIETLPPVDISAARITTRRNPYTHQRQLLTGDVLALLRRKLPGDAFAMVGITMEDLYPEDSWNFVFGQASLRERVGVYSFARYDPKFYGQPPGPDDSKLLLRRSCKVLAHETGHMFGIQHCVFFHCLMNGSNHLEEADARPLHLCPVDLRKLQYGIGFDVAQRYRRLRDFDRQAGFDDEARWLDRRLKQIAATPTQVGP